MINNEIKKKKTAVTF